VAVKAKDIKAAGLVLAVGLVMSVSPLCRSTASAALTLPSMSTFPGAPKNDPELCVPTKVKGAPAPGYVLGIQATAAKNIPQLIRAKIIATYVVFYQNCFATTAIGAAYRSLSVYFYPKSKSLHLQVKYSVEFLQSARIFSSIRVKRPFNGSA
jgi:hypothetical protein